MRLPAVLTWLLDDAPTIEGADRFLIGLGERLMAANFPLVGCALTQAAPHPIITRRTWLWRADTGEVIEALGLGLQTLAMTDPGDIGRDWLNRLGTHVVVSFTVGRDDQAASRPVLSWALSRPPSETEAALLEQTARFAAGPLAVLTARSTLAALLETYLGRRSARQVLAGRLQREAGETIRAALLYADLRGFTELSEAAAPQAVIAALDAWFDRVAGAVHVFGGEVLKFIGDGVLAIFPVGDRPPSAACDAALRAVAAARAGMTHLNRQRAGQQLPPLPFGMALHLGEMLWGNIGTADRLDFTAIGSAVNLVSRLEGLCRPLGQDVLISQAFAAEVRGTQLEPLGEHRLRGIAQPCAVFALPQAGR